jgi:hypothetical protein
MAQTVGRHPPACKDCRYFSRRSGFEDCLNPEYASHHPILGLLPAYAPNERQPGGACGVEGRGFHPKFFRWLFALREF